MQAKAKTVNPQKAICTFIKKKHDKECIEKKKGEKTLSTACPSKFESGFLKFLQKQTTISR